VTTGLAAFRGASHDITNRANDEIRVFDVDVVTRVWGKDQLADTREASQVRLERAPFALETIGRDTHAVRIVTRCAREHDERQVPQRFAIGLALVMEPDQLLR